MIIAIIWGTRYIREDGKSIPSADTSRPKRSRAGGSSEFRPVNLLRGTRRGSVRAPRAQRISQLHRQRVVAIISDRSIYVFSTLLKVIIGFQLAMGCLFYGGVAAWCYKLYGRRIPLPTAFRARSLHPASAEPREMPASECQRPPRPPEFALPAARRASPAEVCSAAACISGLRCFQVEL